MDHQPRQKAPRQSIIKAARELFDAKGFHATTSAGLAAEVAVSVGQISRLFERRTISSSLLSRRIRRCSSRRCSSFQRIRRGRAFGIRCDQGDCEQLERQRATAGCPQRFLQKPAAILRSQTDYLRLSSAIAMAFADSPL
ncbi:helix-turn-helix domain-containing protein [Sphingobium ummariense]